MWRISPTTPGVFKTSLEHEEPYCDEMPQVEGHRRDTQRSRALHGTDATGAAEPLRISCIPKVRELTAPSSSKAIFSIIPENEY